MIKQLIIGVSLAAVIGVQAETAEEAWSKLVRNKRFLRNSAFKYVKNNPKLPNVFKLSVVPIQKTCQKVKFS